VPDLDGGRRRTAVPRGRTGCWGEFDASAKAQKPLTVAAIGRFADRDVRKRRCPLSSSARRRRFNSVDRSGSLQIDSGEIRETEEPRPHAYRRKLKLRYGRAGDPVIIRYGDQNGGAFDH
jgi:hypothetical protein